MQTTIPINFTSEIVDCGYIGEHNAVTLDVTVPEDMLSETHSYRLAFEIGELSARSGVLTATDGIVSYDVPLSVASTRVVNMQLEEYASDESFIKKSALVILQFADSVPNGTVGVDDEAGIVAEITANTAARHTHDNKTTLDMVTPEAFQAISDTVGDRHTHTNKAVIDAITTAPPQIYNKYYANDGISGAVLLDSATTAQFGAVSDFIPDTAKIIDASVRYSLDGVTADVTMMDCYGYVGYGGVILLSPAFGTRTDAFALGNAKNTTTINDIALRPYVLIEAMNAMYAGAIIRDLTAARSTILGFTVTYIM